MHFQVSELHKHSASNASALTQESLDMTNHGIITNHSMQGVSTAAQQLYEYVGCYYHLSQSARPCGDTPSNIAGVQQCRDCCSRKGYIYFGFECPHASGRETHCECGNGGGLTRDSGIQKCSQFNPRSGGHCAGPFTVSGSIGTYALGAGLYGSVYR